MNATRNDLDKQKIEMLWKREICQTPYVRLVIFLASIFMVWLLRKHLTDSAFPLVCTLYGFFVFLTWVVVRYRWLPARLVTQWWLFGSSLDTIYAGFLIYFTGGISSLLAPLFAGSLLRFLLGFPQLIFFHILVLIHIVVYCTAAIGERGSGALAQPEFWFTFLLLLCIGLVVAYTIKRHDEISLASIQLAGESAEFKMMALTDGLTGIYNYRYFQHRLVEEIRRAARFNVSLSLLIFDLDFFKIYNDTYGHPQGDSLLRNVADTLHRHLRSSDILCRYGGDEFVVILIGANYQDGLQIAGNLKEAIENYPFFGKQHLPGGKLTVSVGVATYPTDASNHADLVKVADRRLYQEKASL